MLGDLSRPHMSKGDKSLSGEGHARGHKCPDARWTEAVRPGGKEAHDLVKASVSHDGLQGWKRNRTDLEWD